MAIILSWLRRVWMMIPGHEKARRVAGLDQAGWDGHEDHAALGGAAP